VRAVDESTLPLVSYRVQAPTTPQTKERRCQRHGSRGLQGRPEGVRQPSPGIAYGSPRSDSI